MTIFKKNTVIFFRVFFLLFIVGLIGLLWQQNNDSRTQVKAEGGRITEGIVGAPRFINPVLAQTQTDLDLTRLIFTPILSIDRNGDTFYQIADSIDSSSDGLTYTLNIRRDIKFQDNVTMTADDIIFTIESIQDSLIKSPLETKWQGVTVEKIDQYTVLFKLARPFNDFLYNLEIGVLPKHIWGVINPQEFIFSKYNTNPIGSGPYFVDAIKESENGIPSKYLLKNSRSSVEKPYIKNIDVVFFSNEDSLVKALNNKKIDAAYGISPESSVDLDNSERIHTATLPRVFALFLNQDKQPIFSSEKIREALNHAINKEALAKTVFNNYAAAINSPLGLDATNVYSPEKAEELIKEDGWKKNSEGIYTKVQKGKNINLEFSIAIPNIKDMQSVAEEIKNDLSLVGVSVIVRSYDPGNLNQNIMRPREYESLLFGYEVEKPSDMYAFWHSSQTSDPGLNMSMFKNVDVDKELLAIRSSSKQNLRKLEEGITKTTPAIFLYSPSYIYVLPTGVTTPVLSITKSSDRFNTISEWYKRTRHVWSFFISSEE